MSRTETMPRVEATADTLIAASSSSCRDDSGQRGAGRPDRLGPKSHTGAARLAPGQRQQIASVLVLIILAGCSSLVRYNYDDRKAVASSAPSSVGYAALERHFPISQSIPEYILVQSPHDLRTPQALADLEQMASRVAQLPNVGLVSGITRPLGEVPPEFRATYQAGLVGTRLADGSAQIDQRTGDLTDSQPGQTPWPTASVTCAHRSTRSPPVSRV